MTHQKIALLAWHTKSYFKSDEELAVENKLWHEHKEKSDKLFDDYLATLPGTTEHEIAKTAYLEESNRYWHWNK